MIAITDAWCSPLRPSTGPDATGGTGGAGTGGATGTTGTTARGTAGAAGTDGGGATGTGAVAVWTHPASNPAARMAVSRGRDGIVRTGRKDMDGLRHRRCR
ncbi:hypothetical protein EYF88_01175 [Paracoccus sediminis]|uniref:Uncharacterized protein n=1 Tax=Paracoccus sediminis TaxID=1214787 RepID=A0ABY1YMG8_9RHOB|nr:hypothetical protein EYF88_01175 [Paracoccus sediminis]